MAPISEPRLLLPPALGHEPTDHVDLFAQFVGPGELLLGRVDPAESAEDAARLDAAERLISGWAAQRAYPLGVHRVDIPVLGGAGYFSHINGLQLADRVLAPLFTQVDAERQAAILEQLRAALGGRQLGVLPASELQALHGVLHCAALGVQLPAKSRRRADRSVTDRRRGEAPRD